jgi:tetratricopeptide (TPR) repeat protein
MGTARKKDPRLKQYENTVLDFIEKESGQFVVLSDDTLFLKILNTTFYKYLPITRSCISPVVDTKSAHEAIADLRKQRKTPFLFAERYLNGRSTTDFIESVKSAAGELFCVVLSNEVEKNMLVYLYEVGADNFIIKPLSANTLIEKVALTLKPQTKIGDLIEKAKRSIAEKREDEALKITEQILEIKPNSAAALMIRGDAFNCLGNKGKAVESYKEAHSSAKMYLEPLKRLAGFYRQEGDVQAQIEFLVKLDKLSPLNVRRKLDLGQLHLEAGNAEEAERFFDEAISAATREAYSTISDVAANIVELCSESEAGIAERFCRKALELRKDMLSTSDLEVFNKLGIALRKQGKWKEAISEYFKAMKIAPKDPVLHYNLAMALMEGKEYRDAQKQMKKAFKFDPAFFEGNAPMIFNIGLVHYHNGNTEKAREFFKLAISTDPHFRAAGRMLSQLG